MYTIEELEKLAQNLPPAKVDLINTWLVEQDGYAHIHASSMAMVQLLKKFPEFIVELIETKRALADAQAKIDAAMEIDGYEDDSADMMRQRFRHVLADEDLWIT